MSDDDARETSLAAWLPFSRTDPDWLLKAPTSADPLAPSSPDTQRLVLYRPLERTRIAQGVSSQKSRSWTKRADNVLQGVNNMADSSACASWGPTTAP